MPEILRWRQACDSGAIGGELGARLLIAGQGAPVRRDMNRLAVGEKAHELRIAHPRPGAHAADVDVNEIRIAIIADAAQLEPHRRSRVHAPSTCRAWSCPWPCRECAANVRRPRASAAAAWRWSAASDSRTKRQCDFSRRRRDRLPTPHRRGGGPYWFPDQSPVAQEPIQLFEDFGVVMPVDAIGGVDRFTGMRVIEINRARIAIGAGGFGGGGREEKESGADQTSSENFAA